MSLREVPESGRASNVWPVTQGLVTQVDLDAMVKLLHKSKCSSFDGSRVIGAGAMTRSDHIYHEADIAHVMDVMRAVGVWRPE